MFSKLLPVQVFKLTFKERNIAICLPNMVGLGFIGGASAVGKCPLSNIILAIAPVPQPISKMRKPLTAGSFSSNMSAYLFWAL